jgi:catechol 2,3-dioxygenase-like lactoylglutathione lyase family enzyme
MIKAFHHVAVKASDFEKSLHFYKDLLGLKQTNAWGEGNDRAVMLALDDNSRIELFAGGEKYDTLKSPYIHFAFNVDDPDMYIERVRAEGYAIKMEPDDKDIPGTPGFKARIAFCYGPDGEEVEFFAPIEGC